MFFLNFKCKGILNKMFLLEKQAIYGVRGMWCVKKPGGTKAEQKYSTDKWWTGSC